MKVSLIKEKMAPEAINNRESYPEGAGLYVVQETDGWWRLMLVHPQYSVDSILLQKDGDPPEWLLADGPKAPDELPKPGPIQLKPEVVVQRNDRGETCFHSYNDVLRALAAAAGTLPEGVR